MTSSASKRKIIRQFALIVTLQYPAKLPFKLMQPEPWQIHVPGPRTPVQLRQYAGNLFNLLGIQAAPVVVLE